jgi:hypothetical protein
VRGQIDSLSLLGEEKISQFPLPFGERVRVRGISNISVKHCHDTFMHEN